MAALRRTLAAVAVLLAAVLLWGAGIAPRLVAERHLEVTMPRLPEALDGTRVAFFSDLQVGMWLANTGTVERIVDRLRDHRPDVALLGGDFLYGADPPPAAQVAAAVELVAPLVRAGIPTFAVLGNHDLRSGAAQRLRRGLEGAGIRVLTDAATAVPVVDGAPPLFVVGLRPHEAEGARPARAVAAVPAVGPRVVFLHNPSSFADLPAGSAPLALAGHTHCGQIRLPFTPGWSLVGHLESFDDIPIDGWAPAGYGGPGNALYVSCGVGFSMIPVRLGARPQVVLVTLLAGGDG